MTSTLEPLAAGEIYLLGLEPRRVRRIGRLVAGVLDLWCATTGGRFELTGEGYVVLRRRSDGFAELQIPTGGPEAAAALMDVLRTQLDTMAPDEFRAGWGLG